MCWRVVLCALIGAAFATTPAQGEVVFGAPRTLADRDAAEPQVGVDPQGRATVTWIQVGPEGLIWIQAARLDPTGLPEPPKTLAKFPPATPSCYCPQIVVDSSGRVTVTWQAVVGKYRRIQAAQIDAGGTPGPVYTLSRPEEEGWDQRVAVDGEGRATVSWKAADASNIETVRFGTDGIPEENRVLAEGVPGLGYSTVAVGAGGEGVVVWGSSEGLRFVQLDPNGSPGPIRAIPSTDNSDGIPHAVIDTRGRTTIGWWRGLGKNETRSVRLDHEGNPGNVQVLSPPEEGAIDPELALDPEDRVTAVWMGLQERVRAVRLDDNGEPETVHTLSEGGHLAGLPSVAIGATGAPVVVWAHPPRYFVPDEGCLPNAKFEYESDVVKAVFLAPDGSPARIENVSAFGEQATIADVAVDPLGQPIVAWETFDGTAFCEDRDTRIQVSRGVDVVATDGAPSPSPRPSPAPPAAGVRGKLRLGARAVIGGDGRLMLRVACAAGGGVCEGRVRVLARWSQIPHEFAHSLRGRRGVTVARGRFGMQPGKRVWLRLRLSRLGKKLAQRSSGHALRVVGKGRGVEEGTVLVRLRPHRQVTT